MGAQSSKENEFIPDKKNFKISYCINKNIKTISEIKNTDLSSLLDDYEFIGAIMSLFYYKLKHMGYNIHPINIEFPYYRLEQILDNIQYKGIIISNHNVLNYLKIINECYAPNLNNIYHFLNDGHILLAGIILDHLFAKEVLKVEIFEKNVISDVISDVILIVGYDNDNIFIKTTWTKNILKIDNKFLTNIKEIWNVKLNLK